MTAAQSFIQILGTFLAILFIFTAVNISYIKIASLIRKQLKPLVTLHLNLKNLTPFIKGRNVKVS